MQWNIGSRVSCLSTSGSQAHRLNNCDAWALWLHGTWEFPRSSIEPMFPALAGGFFTTDPLGKPKIFFLLPNHKPTHSLSRPFICWVCFKVHPFVSMLTVRFWSKPSSPFAYQKAQHLVVQWLTLHTSNARDVALILGQGTKILPAVWCGQKKKKGIASQLVTLSPGCPNSIAGDFLL